MKTAFYTIATFSLSILLGLAWVVVPARRERRELEAWWAGRERRR
jgi:hypothetical protein